MAVPKILLFYHFTPLADPEAVRLWQRELAASLKLRGRVIVGPHGINGTLGGTVDACKQYLKRTREYPGFRGLTAKWSEGTGIDESGHSIDFPRLSVKNRPEIVSFGVPDEVRVTADGIEGGGTRLRPAELNDLAATRDDVTFFDGRNAIEAEVGRFKGAIVPPTKTTHDFIAALESGAYDHLKHSPVVTYCTGGIRCEVLTVLMRNRGFEEVYQLDGGIVTYGQQFGNEGLWQGSLAVFDNREVIDVGPSPEVVGRCHRCGSPTPRLRNCSDLSCRERLVTCPECAGDVWCEAHGADRVAG